MAADDKDPTSPATTSYAYDAMAPKWAMISTLLGGTADMRAAGEDYLPAHPAETAQNYRNRLHAAVLFNMTALTLDSLVGKPFAKPIIFGKDMPAPMTPLLDDVDLQGNDVNKFCQSWFYEGLSKGIADIMIDMPEISNPDPSVRTLAADASEGRRPYWVALKPEHVIFRATEMINGEEQYTQVRIREYFTELVGFAEVCVEQILVLTRDTWARYRLEPESKKRGNKPVWRWVAGGLNELGMVPVISFYAGKRLACGVAKPPIEDIAYLNVAHWQSSADQRDILTVTRFPMLGVSGANESNSKQLKIGPHQVLSVKDPTGRYYFVEHNGKAVEVGRQDLLDLEEQMASYGAEFLKRRTGNLPATNRVMNSAEATSPLQDMVARFDDSIKHALWFTAQWMGLGEEIEFEVDVNKDFGFDEVTEAQLKTLLEARKNGDISRETFVKQLQIYGVLDEDFDPKKDDALLKAEQKMLEVRSKTNKAITGRPDPNPEGENMGHHRPTENEPDDGAE